MSNETDERGVSGQEQTEDAIRLTAYFIWESKRSLSSRDLEERLEAEEFVNI
ncbi:MAG: DUF2934 domain-containing protein [Chlorobium sp.]